MKNMFMISDLKASNRRRAYDLLAKTGSISRVELSHQLGISGATVIKIIEYFLENGICFGEEVGTKHTSVGRKPVLMKFNPDYAYAISVFVEGKYISVAVVNMAGEIKAIREFRVLDVWNYLFQNLFEVITELTKEVPDCKPVVIGLALPAVINRNTGNVEEAPLLGEMDGESLAEFKERLEKKFNVPAYIHNDVNVSAYGEFINQYVTETDNMVYVSVGTGVGCGVILDGRLMLGENNSAGEIGYMIFNDDGTYDRKNGGWMEKKINIKAIDTMLEENTDAADKRQEVIEYVAGILSLGITNIVTLLDINTVVLGGVVMEDLGNSLLDAIKEKCQRLCSHELKIELCKSYKPGIIGLSHIAADSIVDQLMAE